MQWVEVKMKKHHLSLVVQYGRQYTSFRYSCCGRGLEWPFKTEA